ncbi:hypothetical protein AVEN_120879-1 [Araneus ventricosus]|uniref:U4/U6.U5 small nuclear ribonucleoprotein 27 kDa protein n=1 Tax=Araneus ventricosus TaxID=182803 RepID=A0A4Y2KRJ4_ARAVE|nr:hypothetical protein AVEN_120879-1 [Araneus ventricosus]
MRTSHSLKSSLRNQHKYPLLSILGGRELAILRGTKGRESTKEAPKRAVSKFLMERTPITDKDLEGKTEEEIEMMKTMGFGNFDTTKGKHVPGNVAYGVHVIHKRKYRQYMNRKGGFNRPLDFVA